ncbi:MAG: phosphatidylinositol-specific phospholipase C/glycerophosphodiester phosphodiesterase family protein [Planctomycetota bacterium]
MNGVVNARGPGPRHRGRIAQRLVVAAWVAMALAGDLGAQPPVAPPPPSPVRVLPHAHAHNDYAHARPLSDALDHGFSSVEADVFPIDGDLLVGHGRGELRAGRTLRALYLDPLRERLEKTGAVHPGAGPFTLLVDFKADGAAAYRLLAEQLAPVRRFLTGPGPALAVIVSGARPIEEIAADPDRLVGIDGRPADLDRDDRPAALVPLVSERWGQLFTWIGTGEMPADQRSALEALVAKAHARGQRLRFWGTPERPAMWRALRAAGVDLVGTDDLAALAAFFAPPAELVGISVVPHLVADAMRYRKPRPDLSARVQLFVRGTATAPTFSGKTPEALVAEGAWAWQGITAGLAAAVPPEDVPADGDVLSVWELNGRSAEWGVGKSFTLAAEGLAETTVAIAAPTAWLSAVTFLDPAGGIAPSRVVVHVANAGTEALPVTGLRLWVPADGTRWNRLSPRAPVALAGDVPAGEKEVFVADTPALPLAPAAVEVLTPRGSLWGALRVRAERFDIGGGWVGDGLGDADYRRLLGSLHVSTGQIGMVGGFTDDEAVYATLPLRLCNKPQPVSQFDNDRWLPRVHAVEFLGEPQYGGGRPVPPQEVYDALLPYRATRLPTSLTHSEERIWALYAGLCDYPHFDAYRVVAPAADAWRDYDRWGGERISWGAPLETIGDLTRSLRDLNRPMACAAWAQGPHDGWKSAFSPRRRRTPTPAELRAQALHALAARITSLYWFNLSARSLAAFPDTHEALRRVGREIRALEPLLVEGDATSFTRLPGPDGGPGWELSVVAAPAAAVLFALDTAYSIDPEQREFVFGTPRLATFAFPLPRRLRAPVDCFRIDAEGVSDVAWRATDDGVAITDTARADRIYVVTRDGAERGRVEARRQAALDAENRFTTPQAAP